MESITSLQNPLIKTYIKLLTSKRFRKRSRKIAIEGPNLVREAINAGIAPLVIFCTDRYLPMLTDDFFTAISPATRIVIIPDSLFAEIAYTKTPQAVAAIIPYSFDVEIFQSYKSDLIVIMDRIQDPGNMGTLIRTAAAAGAGLIFYTPGCTDPFGPKVLRSTAGSIFHVKLQEISDHNQLIDDLKGKGVQMVVTDSRGDNPYWAAVYQKPIALVIGNEADGVSEVFLENADLVTSIPLDNSIESLNAAVAAGIILFEIKRQKNLS